jgi:tRNA G18 (ribose-2'-O)-methylase SpoU
MFYGHQVGAAVQGYNVLCRVSTCMGTNADGKGSAVFFRAISRGTRAIMMIEHITHIDDPRLEPYRMVREPESLHKSGLFIAESRRAVERLLSRSRFTAQSVFVTETALRAMEPILSLHAGDIPIYLGTRELMNQVAGFNIHRGCLAAGSRGRALEIADLIAPWSAPSLVVITESVSDPDNIGAIFRNSHAFGCTGVVLAAGSADPLYRKAIRVSLSASLMLPFAVVSDWPEPTFSSIKKAGYTVVAVTPHSPATPISPDLVKRLGTRIALLFGAEGDGLSRDALQRADVRVRIPMANEVDSINVAAASAIALHTLSQGLTTAP